MPDTGIKAVLFDLGETLLCFGKVNVLSVFREGAELSTAYLKRMNQPVKYSAGYLLRSLLVMRIGILWSHLVRGRDFDSLEVLKKHGQKKGIRLTDDQWKELNWCWYEPLSRRIQPEEDLPLTLDKLRRQGLRLGIVSNTFVNSSVLDRHLSRLGLLEFFDVRMYSYNYPFRKPDRRIFDEAARRIDVSPHQIVFVGDKISADVRGALSAGMTPVLKKAPTNRRKSPPNGVRVIEKLSELPKIVENLNKS